ncbi:MAG: RES family NAD+ phosphorylase, partial [Acidimicrobiales bacterium]
MLVFRVFPSRPDAAVDEPGHPLYLHPDQGTGRWDNPDLYRAMYVAASASGAIGETFAHLSSWSQAMLAVPVVAGAERMLAVYSLDEEEHPLLDFDDSTALLQRGLRPTDIIICNRPRTRQIARDAFSEGGWSGLSWWSMHRPQWTLHMLWQLDSATVEDVQPLPGHPALRDAGTLLA